MIHENVAILHPGQMGLSVAATLQNSGCTVYWASQGRSRETQARAHSRSLVDAVTLPALAQACRVVVSVCPPAVAEGMAAQIKAAGFTGLYIDANAIAPARAVRIGQALAQAGIDFVDGGIIGGPAWEPGRTWLYLSGPQAERAAGYFQAGPLGVRVISPEVGKASALKMCFAAYTKGTSALLCAVQAAAQQLGVLPDLQAQWGADFSAHAAEGAVTVTAKAWRFSGEMDEIAATFAQAGLPAGFHQAAAEVYRRLEGFKDADPKPALAAVLQALLTPDA